MRVTEIPHRPTLVATAVPEAREGTEARCDRLSAASRRHVIEPEARFAGRHLQRGPVVAEALLTVAGLGLELTEEQRIRLSREELASMLATGIRFEAMLNAGFSLQIAERYDARDPRVAYMLHEIGEETRHSRAFVALLRELAPAARNPFEHGWLRRVQQRLGRMMLRAPALFTVFVLAGEEIPDLLQRRAAEHPETDPYLAEVNRYHRMEEARHLAFARTVLPEHWRAAGRLERWRVRHLAPWAIRVLFDTLVHPGVYETVGLPGWPTWRAAHRTPEQIALRHEATRPILRALLDLGVLPSGRVPAGWRNLCGVDRSGLAADADPGG